MLATVAAMILVDREKVSLDEPVTTYIKNFSMPLDQRYRDITVRMLLNHSSGLPGNDMTGSRHNCSISRICRPDDGRIEISAPEA